MNDLVWLCCLENSLSEIFTIVFTAQSQIFELKEPLDIFECIALLSTAQMLLARL